MAQAKLVCWNCGTSLDDLPRPITRHNNCPKCFNDLHCCRLCRHYRATDAFPCDDERADPPIDKETANFCDFFRPVANAYSQGSGHRQEAARDQLDALFGAAEEPADETAVDASPTEEDEARAKLEALFGKNAANKND